MYDKFIENIDKCLELSKIELSNRKSGIAGESTINQLENLIIPELINLLNQIKNDNIPPRCQRYLLSYANASKVWNWSMENPTTLYDSLSLLHYDYVNLKDDLT